MPLGSSCERPSTKRHGRDGAGRQRFVCRPCHRTFTAASASASAGSRWPPEGILTAVRWSLAHPRAATSVMVFRAERGIDVSRRTVLRWVQPVGPLRAAEGRRHRRRPGRTCYVDEGFCCRDGGQEKRYVYRAIDEHGQVLDVRCRDHRDTASAEALFRRTLTTSGVAPTAVVRDHHQPSSQTVRGVVPEATHVRTGPHRARGETTKGVERSHIATRDRLRASRGLKTPATGQRFFAGFEAVQALGRGHVHLERLVPGSRSGGATPSPRRGRWSRPSPCWGHSSAGRSNDGLRPEP
jgi:putative transposase